MRYFRLIRGDLDISGVRQELRQSTLWVDLDKRPNRPATHAGTHRIQLRTNQQIPRKHYHDIHETRDLPAWKLLSQTRQFVLGFAAEVGGEIGHVRVTNLLAGCEVVPHVDVGEYCANRDRYHLVINSPQGTLFNAGDETVTMRENELWWFDNKAVHSVKNLSDVPRTHLIFDLLHKVRSAAR